MPLTSVCDREQNYNRAVSGCPNEGGDSEERGGSYHWHGKKTAGTKQQWYTALSLNMPNAPAGCAAASSCAQCKSAHRNA